MPELPEVETIARGLAPELEGRAVAGVVVREPRLRTRVARDFAARLRGFGPLSARRRYNDPPSADRIFP